MFRNKDAEPPRIISPSKPTDFGLQEEVDHFSHVVEASSLLLKNTPVSPDASSGQLFSREGVLTPFENSLLRELRVNAEKQRQLAERNLAASQVLEPGKPEKVKKNNQKTPRNPGAAASAARPLTFRPAT